MQQLLEALKVFENEEPGFERLGDFVFNFDFSILNYEPLIPAAEKAGDYGRNILSMDSVECVLLNWDPGVESGIHHHQGFWGYVIILEGKAQDIHYKWYDDKLVDARLVFCSKGGVIDERDDIIHKISNPSGKERLITLHLYAPPVESFDGMDIYDLKNERIGSLSSKAKTASWSDEKGHFKEITESAFKYIPFTEFHKDASHRMVLVSPKPSSVEIVKMVKNYYDEQAKEYDNFDQTHPSRSAYNDRIDSLISEDLKNNYPETNEMLVLASGTGRRALKQKEMSGLDFTICGVDLSPMMSEVSQGKFKAVKGNWLEVELDIQFDVATYLYAFGHVPSGEERLRSLQKINRHLKMGGPLYLDAFNLEDTYEWGPEVLEYSNKHLMSKHGYEKGDIFYRKTGGNCLAFLHYFEEDELKDLFSRSGFKIEKLHYIGYKNRSGEILEDKTGGFYFVKAIKDKDI